MSWTKSPRSAPYEETGQGPRKSTGARFVLQNVSEDDVYRQLRRLKTMNHLWRLWRDEEGQDIAEYAVMLAVILVIVVGTVRLIGSNANNVFSNVASSIQ